MDTKAKKPSKLLHAAREAVAVAKGKRPAARITIKGHAYVPEAEVERLRTAIQWALGEAPDADGKWFGQVMPEQKDGERLPPWWWRKPLRKLAGMNAYTYDKQRRTLTRAKRTP